jgi:CO/xanthine dehydrogenase Mo-binding subunit
VGVGSAVVDACNAVAEQLRRALHTHALQTQGGASEDFELAGDCILAGGERITLVDVLATDSSIPVREVGFLSGSGVHNVAVEPATRRSRSLFYEVCFSTAEVEVMPETGQVLLRRFVSVTDVGRALDRKACEGQDLGAAMMGIGTTLSEALIYADGQLSNPNLVEYSLPTPRSLPRDGLKSILIENGDGPGPFGAKGIGEAGIIAVAPAIANAVFRASGVRLRELPLTPERVWEQLNAKKPETENVRLRTEGRQT